MGIFYLLPFVLAQAASPVSALPPGKGYPNEADIQFGRQPLPLTNPGDWVSSRDYPIDALREGKGGVVRFELIIDATGIVSNCQVTMSSGTASLDDAACSLIAARARFDPARDAEGKPIIGTYRNSVRWAIPRSNLPTPWQMVMSFRVGTDGKVDECRIESVSGSAAEERQVGPMPCATESFEQGFIDQAGKPVTRRVRMTRRVEVLPE